MSRKDKRAMASKISKDGQQMFALRPVKIGDGVGVPVPGFAAAFAFKSELRNVLYVKVPVITLTADVAKIKAQMQELNPGLQVVVLTENVKFLVADPCDKEYTRDVLLGVKEEDLKEVYHAAFV